MVAGERGVDEPRGGPRAGRSWRGRGRVLAVVTLAVTVVGLAATADEDDGDDSDLLVRGGELYQANCAACHGPRGEGGPGPDVLAGPSLTGLQLAYVDLTVRTGRMPIPEPSVGVYTDRLDDAERRALLAYARERFGLTGEIPVTSSGDPARGQSLYVRNCAACHGAAADGGISGASVRVPPLIGLDGVAIAAATRVGPFDMPAFDPAVLSDDDVDDIIGYLDVVADTPRTLAGVREVDQVTAALFAAGLGLAASVVLLLVARARRWSPREPGGTQDDPPFRPRP